MRRLPGVGSAIPVLLLLPLLWSSPTAAQQGEFDWYVSIDSIPGCSTAQGQSGKIDILELHQLWYSAESIPPAIQTREFIFSKELDCASRLLWDALRQQTQLPVVLLEGFDRFGPPNLRQRIELRNVFIQSIETSDRFPDGRPVERLRWIYNEVEMQSFCFRPSDQTPCGEYTWTHTFQNPV